MTYIYLISNINNDPKTVYIGKTLNISHRKYHHKRRFGNDIKFEVIEEVDSIMSIDWKPLEIKWIKYYENLGYALYNKNSGGNGPDKHSDLTKNKISQSKKGNNYNLGTKYSDDSKEKIRIRKKGQKYNITKKGNEHGNYGVVRNDEWKKKQSLSKSGKTLSKEHVLKISENKIDKGLKPIIQYDLNMNVIKHWPSLKTASKELGINSGDISSCCSGKQKTAHGYIWKHS